MIQGLLAGGEVGIGVCFSRVGFGGETTVREGGLITVCFGGVLTACFVGVLTFVSEVVATVCLFLVT